MKLFSLLVVLAIAGTACAATEIGLSATPDRVELTSGRQRLVFARSQPSAALVMTSDVLVDGRWEPLFDGGGPLVSGPKFDLVPDRYRVAEDSADRKAVLVQGTHANPPYDWDALVEARRGSDLIHVVVTVHLRSALTLSGPQPAIALWLKHPVDGITVDQGPLSIYGKLGQPYAHGFPAAYLWDRGREAAIFFNMTPETWMSPKGVYRFYDSRVETRSAGGMTGLGLHTEKLSGPEIAAGPMVIEYYLYSGPRAQRPTKMEGLDTMVRVFAPLHPKNTEFPRNRLENKEVSWEYFARRAITDLMVPKEGFWTTPANWLDDPARLVEPVKTLTGHPGGAGGTGGDFSCCNNHLTPWILFGRVEADRPIEQFAQRMTDSLPLYYDPKAALIRHGTREPPAIGDMEMSWQNFFFHLESDRAAGAMAPEDFNPAIRGRYLMAMDGLIQLAHNVDYVMPQWFDPYAKQPIVQNDVKQLGKVREPWQVGTYAYLMLRAHDMTGEEKYLKEARTSIETLLTRMKYREDNDVYHRTYDDPADFPMTELFGNAYGIVAAKRIATEERDERFAGYSRQFLDSLLRLTMWYEDRGDAICRDLRNAALFYPHGGANLCCPWETTEAHLAIAWALQNDVAPDLEPLLLKLSNLNRIDSFYFYPATYSPAVAALDPGRRKDIGQFWPIEPMYNFEATGGCRGPTSAYMSSNAMWNWWMYEALATAEDRRVMVLNTDVFDHFQEAVSGAELHLIVFNPTDSEKATKIKLRHPAAGGYLMNGKPLSAAELSAGIAVRLKPMESLRLTLRNERADEMEREIRLTRAAQASICNAYSGIQSHAGPGQKAESQLASWRESFANAMKAYREKKFKEADSDAKQIVRQLSIQEQARR